MCRPIVVSVSADSSGATPITAGGTTIIAGANDLQKRVSHGAGRKVPSGLTHPRPVFQTRSRYKRRVKAVITRLFSMAAIKVWNPTRPSASASRSAIVLTRLSDRQASAPLRLSVSGRATPGSPSELGHHVTVVRGLNGLESTFPFPISSRQFLWLPSRSYWQ